MGAPVLEARNLIKSPSQKSSLGGAGGGSVGGGGGGSGGGDVEVRVRTTARGTSVSVLLPSAAANAGETGGTAVVGSGLIGH